VSDAILFTNATLLDCTGAPPRERASVVVEDGTIKDITVEAPPPGASFATTVDCRGRTLMPGLIDAHVHVAAIDVNILEQHRAYPESLASLKIGRILSDTLRQGYTTVRDAGGADWGFKLAVAEGVIDGPRLLVAGRPISQTGGHGDSRRRTEQGDPISCCPQVGMMHSVCDGVDGVRRGVREQIRRGADQIKIMASGGAMSPTDELDTCQYSMEELRAAVEEAENAGTYVMAHAYSARAVRRCVEAGIRSIEHGNLIDEETARLLAEAGTFLVPTLSTYERLYADGEKYGVPRENLNKIGMAHERGLEALKFAYDNGVKIASGSDLLGPMAADKHRELALKAQVMGPMDALVATTKVNAELLRLQDEIGSVEIGKRADIIVVDGDPLADVTVFGRDDALTVIMQGGRFVTNAA
jgi:imidazolonepropionase-like amidohydrolase